MIAAEGGELSLDGGVTVRIPAGALPGDLPVTITRFSGDDTLGTELEGADSLGGAFNVDIGGATLASPLTLEIPFDSSKMPDGASRETAFVAYFDAQQSKWVPVGGVVDPDRDVIIVETDHLSWWNPFTWNWEAWVAVLKKTLSLNLSDFVEAVAILTEECVEASDIATVDNSSGNSVIKGCVNDDDQSSPELRVINLKSFHIGVNLPDLSPMGSEPDYPLQSILEPGEAVRIPAPTTIVGGFLASANFTDESMWTFVVSLVLRMVPGGDLVPNEGLSFVADGLAKVMTAEQISQGLETGDTLSAAEGVVELITGDSFIETFAKLATEYGQANGIDMMTKWTQAGIQKTLLAVAAVDVIISTTDFLANYFFNNQSQVVFTLTGVPIEGQEVGSSLTTDDTTPGSVGPLDFSNPENVARRYVAAVAARDKETLVALATPSQRIRARERLDDPETTPLNYLDLRGCDIHSADYYVQTTGASEVEVEIVWDSRCAYDNGFNRPFSLIRVSLEKLSGNWYMWYIETDSPAAPSY